MPRDFKSIKEAFDSEPGLTKIKEIMNSGDIVSDFEKIFPELKQVVKATRAERGTLTLRVENAAWRSELKFKENEIIGKINSFYNEKRVDKIKFASK